MRNRKLIICFFGNASSIHTIKWARYFSEKGHIVHLLSFDLPETDDLKGIKIQILKKRIPTITNPFYTLINILSSLKKVRKIMKEIQPDIIHAHYFTSYGFLASFIGFHPFIITAWGTDILVNPKKNLVMRFITQHTANKADLFTCDAKHMKEAMIRLKIPEPKIKIINFGIDTKQFSPGPRNEKIIKELELSNYKIIISLKWPDPLSDYETFIKAASLVVKENPETRFLIIGPTAYPDYLKKLKDMIKELDLIEKVKFLGNILNKKIPEYLRISDIYVCTSLTDAGLATSTAEAMACELPVIITDFGDNKAWVQNGKNGFLVPLRNYKVLAEKIIHLLNNKNTGKKFGEISRRIIREKNDYYNEMAKMEKLYFGLINK